MTRRSSTLLIAVTLAIAVPALSACGSSDNGASQQQIEQAKRDAAAQQKIKDKQAQLEKELAALKKQKSSSGGSSGGSSSGGNGGSANSGTTGSGGGGGASCGAGVTAGANTSCAFALNVAQAYFRAGGGSPTLSVYSPVTNQTYTMNCVAGAPTVCRGGNNAVVYVR